MEFKQVVGRRRSIRFFEPSRPGEREKTQTILEAARLASCVVNAFWLRAIVVERDKLPKEKLEQLKTPVAALTLDLAPLHIYFFCDPGVVRRIKGERLEALAASRAFAGKDPDAMIRECVRESKSGKRISSKGRRFYNDRIAEWQASLPDDKPKQAQAGNAVRSFLIHNGIFLQSGLQA